MSRPPVSFWLTFGSLSAHFRSTFHRVTALPCLQNVLHASKLEPPRRQAPRPAPKGLPFPFGSLLAHFRFTFGSLSVHFWLTFHRTFLLAKRAPREQIRAAKAPSAKVLSQSVPFHLTHGDEPFPFHCTDAPSVCLSLLHYTIIIYFLFIKQKNNNRQRQTDRQTDTRPVISNTERFGDAELGEDLERALALGALALVICSPRRQSRPD